MNTVTTNKSIHASELALCGCRVCPDTGARFITCQTHAQAPRSEPLAKREGLRPLCPVCSSQRIKPAGINIFCIDCSALFEAADLSYGLSVDSKPKQCHACNAVTFDPCTCHQQEVAK